MCGVCVVCCVYALCVTSESLSICNDHATLGASLGGVLKLKLISTAVLGHTICVHSVCIQFHLAVTHRSVVPCTISMAGSFPPCSVNNAMQLFSHYLLNSNNRASMTS